MSTPEDIPPEAQEVFHQYALLDKTRIETMWENGFHADADDLFGFASTEAGGYVKWKSHLHGSNPILPPFLAEGIESGTLDSWDVLQLTKTLTPMNHFYELLHLHAVLNQSRNASYFTIDLASKLEEHMRVHSNWFNSHETISALWQLHRSVSPEMLSIISSASYTVNAKYAPHIENHLFAASLLLRETKKTPQYNKVRAEVVQFISQRPDLLLQWYLMPAGVASMMEFLPDLAQDHQQFVQQIDDLMNRKDNKHKLEWFQGETNEIEDTLNIGLTAYWIRMGNYDAAFKSANRIHELNNLNIAIYRSYPWISDTGSCVDTEKANHMIEQLISTFQGDTDTPTVSVPVRQQHLRYFWLISLREASERGIDVSAWNLPTSLDAELAVGFLSNEFLRAIPLINKSQAARKIVEQTIATGLEMKMKKSLISDDQYILALAIRAWQRYSARNN